MSNFLKLQEGIINIVKTDKTVIVSKIDSLKDIKSENIFFSIAAPGKSNIELRQYVDSIYNCLTKLFCLDNIPNQTSSIIFTVKQENCFFIQAKFNNECFKIAIIRYFDRATLQLCEVATQQETINNYSVNE
jgi:hypothetical protein